MTDQAQGKQEWTVSGMDCAACTTKVTRAVERLPGVSEVRVGPWAYTVSIFSGGKPHDQLQPYL